MLHLKDINRIREILAVFFEERLGHYVAKAKLHIHLPFTKRFITQGPLSSKTEQAIALRHAFEKLGPTFVKLGQLLSLRPDLVPKEYCREFEKLQDHVPSFPYTQAKKIVEGDLGKPLDKLFKTFSKKPIASASIAQVHKVTLKNGKVVAVKVLRPNIKDEIDTDLDIMFHIASSLERHFPKLRNYRPVGVVKEFALWTRRELNFKYEAHNALRLKEEMSHNNKVKVPHVHLSHSSSRVFTMEFIEGVKLDDLLSLKKYKVNRHKIVMTYFTSILEQALLRGLFHADPHPANIFIQKNKKLVYLDYGIMGELSAQDRKKIIAFIEAIPEKNPEKILAIITSMARDTSKADIPAFKEETLDILSQVYDKSIKQKSFGHALYEIIGAGAKHGVVFDPNHVLVAKAFYQAEGLAIKLDPNFKILDGFNTFAQQYLHENYSPIKMIKKVKKSLFTHAELLRELPSHIAKIIKRIEQPQQQKVDITPLIEYEERMRQQNKKKVILGVSVLLLLVSSVLFYLEGRTDIFGVPISVLLFILALLLLGYYLFYTKKEVEDGENNQKSD